MRRVGAGTMVAALVAGLVMTSPAQAGVKEGVDAWQAGDYAKAVGEWRKPADAGDADAQFNLAQAYKLGRGVPTDLAAAQQLYYKAAVQGHEQAQANLGLILFQNGDRKGALPWIQKAADRGEPRAQYVLGTALFNGDIIAKDWPKAYALMTRAAASGLPQATTSIAQMDKFIPMAQRQQGISMAQAMEKSAAGKPVQIADAPTVAKPVPVPPAAPPVTKPGGSKPVAAAAKPATVVAEKPAAKPVADKREATPKPAPAKAAAAKPAAGGKWRVQLGAYSSAASARAAWTGVKAPGLKGLQPFIVKAGAVHRLQAGPFATKSAAEKACASAKSSGKACFVISS